MKKPTCLLATCVGILLLAGCATRSKPFPPKEAYESPPYSVILEGLKPELPDPCEELPVLQPGAAVSFACSWDSSIVSGTCEAPLRIEVLSPRGWLDLLVASNTYHFSTTKASRSLFLHKASAEMKTTRGSATIAGQFGKGNMATAQSEGKIAMGKAKGSMATALDDMSLSKVDAGDGMETEIGGASLSRDEAEGSMETETGNASLSRDEAGGSMATVLGGDSLRMVSGQHGEGIKGSEGEIDVARFGGMLAGMMEGNYNSDFMRGYFDIDAIKDEFIVDGIYGESTMVLLVDGFIVSDQERGYFLVDLASRKSLSILLNRNDNNFLRDDYEGQPGAPKLEMSFALIRPKGAAWHGGLALLQMSIRNTGNLPAFDVLAANKIPENTTFLKFANQENLPQWLVRGYLTAENLLYWRLYQPLKPGETFKSTFAIKLDEWDVNDFSTDNENR